VRCPPLNVWRSYEGVPRCPCSPRVLYQMGGSPPWSYKGGPGTPILADSTLNVRLIEMGMWRSRRVGLLWPEVGYSLVVLLPVNALCR
jgi:hypothetical protein